MGRTRPIEKPSFDSFSEFTPEKIKVKPKLQTVSRLAILWIPLLLCTSCPSRMIEIDGHRVFNPAYLWYLESDARDDWQKPEKVIVALGLQEGDSIADIGTGGGYFTEKFSNTVGEGGYVYTVDVQDAMIARLEKRIAEKDLCNVAVIKAEFENPMLPAESINIAFFALFIKKSMDASNT
jgi:hypothetical protein